MPGLAIGESPQRHRYESDNIVRYRNPIVHFRTIVLWLTECVDFKKDGSKNQRILVLKITFLGKKT